MTGRAVAGKSRLASPIARCGASVYIAPSLSGLIVARDHGRWALSSAVEHYLDMVGVRGSIPLAPTRLSGLLREILVIEGSLHPSPILHGSPAKKHMSADGPRPRPNRPMRPNNNNNIVLQLLRLGRTSKSIRPHPPHPSQVVFIHTQLAGERVLPNVHRPSRFKKDRRCLREANSNSWFGGHLRIVRRSGVFTRKIALVLRCLSRKFLWPRTA